MEIRDITDADLHALAELFIAVFEAPPWRERWEKAWVLDRFNIIYRSYQFCGYVALSEGSPIGAIFSRLASFKGERELEVVEMFVSTGFQRNGVGAALLNELERLASTNGIKNIVLLTDKNAYATSFYSKLGFRSHPENIFMCKNIER